MAAKLKDSTKWGKSEKGEKIVVIMVGEGADTSKNLWCHHRIWTENRQEGEEWWSECGECGQNGESGG
jgi:hypothetical protein